MLIRSRSTEAYYLKHILFYHIWGGDHFGQVTLNNHIWGPWLFSSSDLNNLINTPYEMSSIEKKMFRYYVEVQMSELGSTTCWVIN